MIRTRIGLTRVLGALLIAAAMLGVHVARAQDPAQFGAEEQRTAMAKLDYMVGDWQGTGWMERGGRYVFSGGERVQLKLDGLALLVEGDFSSPDAPGRSVHKTMGVIYYEPRTREYRFDTWLAAGAHGQHELVPLDDGWRWELENQGGRVRYTMRRGTNGEWFEIGERSTDGTNWAKFFEMTLKKRAAN